MAKSLVSVPKKKEREDFISSMIKGEMVRYHKSPEQIAVKAQFSTKTLTTKLGEPGKFTIEELYAILDALEIRVAFIRKPQPL